MADKIQKSSLDPVPSHHDIVEHASRTRLVATIERFLASEISAFQFDEELDEWCDSQDPVVQFVVAAVWYHYDDCDDHFVIMSKAEWDYFQRLLLLLKSDCSLQTVRTRTWSWTQLVAAACLTVLGAFIFWHGWGAYLLLISMPLGLVSMLISRLRRKGEIPRDPFAEIIYPFASFSDLQVAYDSVRFAKKRYPREIGNRQISRLYGENIQGLMTMLAWLVYAPAVLLLQMCPIKTTLTMAKSK